MKDNKIEIGLQLPQTVDNRSDNETIAPDDSPGAVDFKCVRAITKEIQRVLFNFFGDIDVKVKNFKLESQGYSEEEAAALKLRLATILGDLKTAMFQAEAEIKEDDDEYKVEGVIDGPNMLQVKKLLSSLEIIQTVDSLRAKTHQDIKNLDIVIERSKRLVGAQPVGVELVGKEKKKHEDAQATIDDRTPKLEKKHEAYDEITGFLDEFMRLETIDIDKFWEGAQALVGKLEQGNYLDPAEKNMLTDLKKIYAELKAECALSKGKEVPADPELAHKRKSSLILRLALGFYVFSTLLAGSTFVLNKYYPMTGTVPLHKTKAVEILALRVKLLKRTDKLLKAKKESEQKFSGLTRHLVNYLGDRMATKLPPNATEKEAAKVATKHILNAVKAMMRAPFENPLMKPEQLKGEIPAIKFVDRFKGKTFTVEGRIKKYQAKILKEEDLTEMPDVNYEGTRLHSTLVQRNYVVSITFDKPLQKHSTEITNEEKVTYFQKSIQPKL